MGGPPPCGGAEEALTWRDWAQLWLHYDKMDQSRNDYVYNYGLMNLEKLPNDALLIVKGDVITNSVRYLQRCEGYRPDVQHLDQSMMTYEWFVKKQACPPSSLCQGGVRDAACPISTG